MPNPRIQVYEPLARHFQGRTSNQGRGNTTASHLGYHYYLYQFSLPLLEWPKVAFFVAASVPVETHAHELIIEKAAEAQRFGAAIAGLFV